MLPALVALGLAGVTAATPSTEPPRKVISVYLIRRCPPKANCLPLRIVTRMKHETERIWSSLDVQIAWIDSIDARPAAPAAGLTVMLEEGFYPHWTVGRDSLLAGVHQPTDPCGWGLARLWVRHILIHVASVRRDGHAFISLPNALADTFLARALGRALAHEIGHYLLGTAEHSVSRAHASVLRTPGPARGCDSAALWPEFRRAGSAGVMPHGSARRPRGGQRHVERTAR